MTALVQDFGAVPLVSVEPRAVSKKEAVQEAASESTEGRAFYVVTTTLGVLMVVLSVVSVTMLLVFNPAW